MFSNQNCELGLTDSGDLQLVYLDGDPLGIKGNLAKLLQRRKAAGLNRVSWWGGRGKQLARSAVVAEATVIAGAAAVTEAAGVTEATPWWLTQPGLRASPCR